MTNEVDNTRVEALKIASELLPADDARFANDLIHFFHKNAALTQKQWYWVDKLVDRALKSEAPPSEQLDQNFLKVFKMFSAASEHIKYPKIHLLAGNYPVCLSLAGPRSKHFGKIQLTDGEPYSSNAWYGVIDSKGVWTKPRNKEVPSDIQDIIAEFASSPERVASEYGKLTGSCCFCHRQLTDDRSVDVGYGPICAKRFNLRWG